MSLSCRDAARMLSEKRDRRLSWRARISLRLHMFACKVCQVYGSQLAVVNRVCNEAGVRAEDKCPGELSVDRKRKIKDAIARDSRPR